MVRVYVSSHLHRYTNGRSELQAQGASLDEVARDLDRQYPGLRFRVVDEQNRIREHIHFFINQDLVRTLGQPVGDADEVHIIGALSGG